MYDVLIPVPVPVADSTAAIASAVPQHHPTGDVHQATARVMLDHLAQQQPGDRHQPRPTRPAGPHRVAEDPGEGGHVARQAIDADQERQALGTRADHPHDGRDQGQVAARR